MALPQSLCSFSLLIVEDDQTSRDVIARMVAKKFPDCRIHTADNGMKGLELFRKVTPDIVLTDVNMPAMGGFEMIQQIRSINVNVTYIVLTAYADKIIFDKFNGLGFCAFLFKPLDFKQLFAALEKCSARICREENTPLERASSSGD